MSKIRRLEPARPEDISAPVPFARPPDSATSVRVPDAVVPAPLAADVAAAEDYLQHQHAASTRRAYRADWACFTAWCAGHELSPLPASAETVALFLASEAAAGRAPSTLGRRTAAIRLAHRAEQYPVPTEHETVKALLRGIRRKHRDRPSQQKAPALAADIAAMVETIDRRTLPGQRDYALLLLGFAGAFRRSELVALTVADLTFSARGLKVKLAVSKGDQEGHGQTVAIVRGQRHCPVLAVRGWLRAAGIENGAVFRRFQRGGHVGNKGLNPATVAVLVKTYAARAGLDPAQFAGHSLRSGFLTSAAEAGASLFKLQEVSRHQSLETLRRYVREVELFDDHAGETLL